MRYNGITYLISEGFSNVFKNKKGTMTSLVTMICAMFLFGAAFAIGQNVNYIMKQVQQEQGIEVFILNDASDEDITKLGENIKKLDGVSTATFKSKQEALDSVKESFKDYPEAIAGYENDYIFPASYVVKLTDLSKAQEVENAIEKMDSVKNIRSSNDTINTLLKIANGIKVAIAVVFAGLLVIAITIISNTIKLSVHSRRKEISIMKYVGATNGFIRWPFIVEGLLIGLFAAVITLLIIGGLYDLTISKILESSVLQTLGITLLKFTELAKSIAIVYLSLGIGVGVLGSAISMKKYLEV